MTTIVLGKRYEKGISVPALSAGAIIKRASPGQNYGKGNTANSAGKWKEAGIGLTITEGLTDLWKKRLQSIRGSAI